MNKQDNPFYSNHVFKDVDIDRCKLTFSDKLRTLFHPMYVQISEGYVFNFKIVGGHYYLFGAMPLPDPPKEG